MRRLRRTAGARRRPWTYTDHARTTIKAAAGFLGWLGGRGTTLSGCRQADVDDWLATGPGTGYVREFLTWAARHGHCPHFDVPGPQRRTGPAITDSQRWDLAARLLHDDSIDVTDRIAGCLVLLYGQAMTRIAALTASQVSRPAPGKADHLSPARRPPPRARHPRPGRAPRRPHRPRRPDARRRARRPPRPAPRHRRQLDAPSRSRLDPLRRRASPRP
jgi:hypothetical protein